MNQFSFTHITTTSEVSKIQEEVRPIITEGLLELFKRKNQPTDGLEVDIKATILEAKSISPTEFEYTIGVEVSDIIEDAELIE